MMKSILALCLFLTVFENALGAEKVLLKDIEVLTLRKGQYTTGRRTKPVPQLHCLGGFLGCETVILHSVQCYNRGFDGKDYQWECKADIPKNFKFGKMDVICEGYDYPEDPYVLAGSCGLQYQLLDMMDSFDGGSREEKLRREEKLQRDKKKSTDNDKGFSPLTVLFIFAAVIVIGLWYLNYGRPSPTSTSSEPTQPPPYGFRSPSFSPPPYTDGDSQQPPPPGFNTGPSFDNSQSYGFKSSTSQQQQQQAPNQNAFGGFWTGAGLGGLAGYLFGSRRSNTGYNQMPSDTYNNPGHSFFGESDWRHRNTGSQSGFGSWGLDTSTSSSSETRSASGYAETKRR